MIFRLADFLLPGFRLNRLNKCFIFPKYILWFFLSPLLVFNSFMSDFRWHGGLFY